MGGTSWKMLELGPWYSIPYFTLIISSSIFSLLFKLYFQVHSNWIHHFSLQNKLLEKVKKFSSALSFPWGAPQTFPFHFFFKSPHPFSFLSFFLKFCFQLTSKKLKVAHPSHCLWQNHFDKPLTQFLSCSMRHNLHTN